MHSHTNLFMQQYYSLSLQYFIYNNFSEQDILETNLGLAACNYKNNEATTACSLVTIQLQATL